MSIFRVKHNKNYTVINNTICSDVRLSWKAKGIWLYAFSRPDDWSFNMTDLVGRSTDGEKSVYAGLRELEDTGYLNRVQSKDENGKWQASDWFFHEIPQELKENVPHSHFGDAAKGDPEKAALLSTEDNQVLKSSIKGTEDFSRKEDRIHMCLDVYLTQAELDDCVKFHGSREKVIAQIQQITDSPKREKEIKDWHNAIKVWKFRTETVDRSNDNEAYGRQLEDMYDHPGNGWAVMHCHDHEKDQKGTYFYSKGNGSSSNFLIAYVLPDWEKQVMKAIEEKKMKKRDEK